MKPSIPKGTRDFSPQEIAKRNYIFDIIRKIYQLHGFQPIETPAMENLDVLTGKYGEEGDNLIFKILNNGDYSKDIPLLYKARLEDGKTTCFDDFTKNISEKALRYDLTVPFARYVVQHRNDIVFPFKRYQIQPVWRADRPQKGRYREFYQCDADIIGSNSLLNEAELIQIISQVFTTLNLPVVIKINSMKIWQGIAESIGMPESISDIVAAMDSIEKIGEIQAAKDLLHKGFTKEQIERLFAFHMNELNESELFKKGLKEIQEVLKYTKGANTEIDLSLARGLNYYTGIILEVKIDKDKCKSEYAGSVCGGGRYDNLTEIFGLSNVSGVGVSFGADRIYDLMEELYLFPSGTFKDTQIMFVNFGEKESLYCMKLMQDLRTCGFITELYPDTIKIGKQFDYANKRRISYVVSVGAKEMEGGYVTVKNMFSGREATVPNGNIDLIQTI